jgi:hypothetical protein
VTIRSRQGRKPCRSGAKPETIQWSKYVKICQNTHAWFRTAEKGVELVTIAMYKWTHRCCRISSAYSQLTPPCSPGSHHQIHPPHRAWSKALIYSAKCEFSGGDGQHVGLKLRYSRRLTFFASSNLAPSHPSPSSHCRSRGHATSAWQRSDLLQCPSRMVRLKFN